MLQTFRDLSKGTTRVEGGISDGTGSLPCVHSDGRYLKDKNNLGQREIGTVLLNRNGKRL